MSVVTPVYNGAAYLSECVESVLAQTYTNWQYTLVDNASTDDTPEIASTFARRDERIRHIRFDEHVGAAANHNRAFAMVPAESEFCKVVQADDWLYPECLERMVDLAQASENIGIVSAYRLWEMEVDLVGLPYSREIVDGREILAQSLTGGPYVTGAPTALLFRSRFVREREPFYQHDFEHHDTEAAYWVMSRSDFACVHQVLTFARRQQGARMNWSSAIGTYLPENIRLLRRYGPQTLELDTYRHQLRKELRRYIRFHVRQCARLSRLSDKRFFGVHLAAIDRIREEGGVDPEVEAAMLFVRTLLLRGGRAGRHDPTSR